MRSNFKYLGLMAAALTLGFSSCSNDEDVAGKVTLETGKPTKMSLAITQPQTYAADANATVAESSILTVDVYIYDATNSFIKRAHLTVANDFTVDGADPSRWNLDAGKEITTTTGTKNIYVGVNLPSALASSIEGTNPATMAQVISAAASELCIPANGFAMFSREVETPELVDADDANYATTNTVIVSVARLLAKIMVEKGSDLTTAVESGGTITGLQFAVGNVNTKYYPLPSASFEDPNWTSPWATGDFLRATNADYKNVYANGTEAKDVTGANAVYTTENTSEGNLTGDHTYVSIRGTYVPTTVLKLKTPGVVADGSEADGGYSTGDTFYRIIVDGKNYFFSDATDATAYASKNSTTAQEYTDGLVYYSVFLNPTPAGAENKNDVLRNTIYKVSITKINGLGAAQDKIGTGTEDDPTDPDDPEYPINDPTLISVQVDIEGWNTTNVQNVEL